MVRQTVPASLMAHVGGSVGWRAGRWPVVEST